MKILILDDHAARRRAVRSFVQATGAEVSEAATADEALAAIRANGPPSTLVCAFRQLMFAEEFAIDHPSVPVIVIGSEDDVDAAITSLHAGVADYVTPPITRARIAEAVWRAEETRRQMNERGMEDLRLQQAVHPVPSRQPPQLPQPTQPTQPAHSALAQSDLDATEVLRAFIDILELREPGTREHAERVSRLAVNLASVLRMAQADVSNIERAGLLHDLRRLGIPNRREISGHPADIRQKDSDVLAILARMPSLAIPARIAAAAHELHETFAERDDAESTLWRSAAILRVANAYDELVTGIGRAPVPPVVAANMLCRDVSKFDPAVLSALESMQRKAYSRLAADPEPAQWEPRRCWGRKQLSPQLVGTVGAHPVRVIDVGYGGFRLEAPATLPATLSSTFELDLPQFGVRATAVWRWTRPLDVSGNMWCGASITAQEPLVQNTWRAFVDRAPALG
jgi:HD-GYP domain-containing protein (c-di-GMP phosphodiesterase class II)